MTHTVYWGIRDCDLQINHKKCEFAICGLALQRNLRICDSGMSPRIWGFEICGLKRNICVPTSVKLSCCFIMWMCAHRPVKKWSGWEPGFRYVVFNLGLLKCSTFNFFCTKGGAKRASFQLSLWPSISLKIRPQIVEYRWRETGLNRKILSPWLGDIVDYGSSVQRLLLSKGGVKNCFSTYAESKC
jgi:hypothetical protein